MKLIVAVDKEWGIGNKGDLLARVREDLLFFRDKTVGKTVVLGSKTLATFPGGRVLKNRTNIVLTRNPDYNPEGAVIAHSLPELLEILKEYNSDEVFIIGGESVYRLMLPYCDTAYVTKFNKSYEKDAYIPSLDDSGEWELAEISEPHTSNPETDTEANLSFNFCTYKRVKE
jgi:dihydrofolate reductase